MIIQLTPETFFESVNTEGPLHVVMHYGETCGPCKKTMPNYELLVNHFVEYNITNVKFYRFHQWEKEYKDFIKEKELKVNGVPTFKFYYYGEKLHEVTASYSDPNLIKKMILEVVDMIEKNMGGFSFYAS